MNVQEYEDAKITAHDSALRLATGDPGQAQIARDNLAAEAQRLFMNSGGDPTAVKFMARETERELRQLNPNSNMHVLERPTGQLDRLGRPQEDIWITGFDRTGQIQQLYVTRIPECLRCGTQVGVVPASLPPEIRVGVDPYYRRQPTTVYEPAGVYDPRQVVIQDQPRSILTDRIIPGLPTLGEVGTIAVNRATQNAIDRLIPPVVEIRHRGRGR